MARSDDEYDYLFKGWLVGSFAIALRSVECWGNSFRGIWKIVMGD